MSAQYYREIVNVKIERLDPCFVESIPQQLEDGCLYVSMPFRTAIHRCCCGCGVEITTPIRPTDWQLTYDGVTVSLSPSIGNWSLPCRSHYWITEGELVDAPHWSNKRIAANRINDLRRKGALGQASASEPTAPVGSGDEAWWKSLVRWLFGSDAGR